MSGEAAVPGRAIVVLGMSRSGTSTVTRVLNLLGVSLGAERDLLAPVARMNAKGFFENRDVVATNEALLETLGGTWIAPPALEPGWELDGTLAPLRERARELLRASFTGTELWGFKDPRLCLTFPFWRELLGEVAFVICHRNALEVAQSLQRRDGLGLDAGLELWLRHAAGAVLHSRGSPRTFIDYAELLQHPTRVVAELARFLGTPERAEDGVVTAQVKEWIERDLRHHAATLADVVAADALSPAGQQLHLLLDLAVSARAREPALRGEATEGEVSDALDVAAEAAARAPDPSRSAPGPGAATRSDGRVRGELIRGLPAETELIVAGPPHGDAERLVDVLSTLHPELAVARAGAVEALVEAPRQGERVLVDARYCTGTIEVAASTIAPLLAMKGAAPAVVLVATDPVRRAIRHHRAMRAVGLERRPLRRALREQLAPGALEAARREPRLTTGYVAWGELGRIAAGYRAYLPAAQILVVDGEELDRAPQDAVAAIEALLGLAPSQGELPPPPAQKPISATELDPELHGALRTHFAADAARLQEATGVRVQWADPAPPEDPAMLAPRAADVGRRTAIVVSLAADPARAGTCLQSIAAHTPAGTELLIAGSAGALDAVRAIAPGGARLIALDEGTSVLGAALGASDADELVLLDDTCVVTDGWLAGLRAVLDSDPAVAAVGPRSNSARFKQGGVWLDDFTLEGAQRYARSFNRSDPERWSDCRDLDPFTVLIRRAALDTLDHRPEGAAGTLSALLGAGKRLVCAGDVFVFNFGRVAIPTATADVPGPEVEGRLVRDSSARVLELVGELALPVPGAGAQALLAAGSEILDSTDELTGEVHPELSAALVRALGSAEVWLLHRGRRRQVTGDPNRVRRLAAVAAVERARLIALPEGPPLAVEDAVGPIEALEAVLPAGAAEIRPERLADAHELFAAISDALEQGRGFGLIRLGSREALVLADGAWPHAAAGAAPSDGWPSADELRAAILAADAIGVDTDRATFACAPLLERVLFHLDLYPPLRFPTELSYTLLGFDAETGEHRFDAPLLELLRHRPVAVVGPLADAAWQLGRRVGLEVGLAVELTGSSQLAGARRRLAELRDRYDLVLLSGVTGRVLAPWLARELGVVALELGHALDRLLYARHGENTAVRREARWQLERYLRRLAQPPPDKADPLEGQLVRAFGQEEIFYIERGRARRLGHRLLAPLFSAPAIEVPAPELARLPAGAPLEAVNAGAPPIYVAVDGRRVRLQIGVRVVHVEPALLRDVPEREALRWLPPPPPRRPGR